VRRQTSEIVDCVGMLTDKIAEAADRSNTVLDMTLDHNAMAAGVFESINRTIGMTTTVSDELAIAAVAAGTARSSQLDQLAASTLPPIQAPAPTGTAASTSERAPQTLVYSSTDPRRDHTDARRASEQPPGIASWTDG